MPASFFPDVPTWVQNLLSALFGGVSIVLVAWVNRKPALDAAIDAKIKQVFDADTRRGEIDAAKIKLLEDRISAHETDLSRMRMAQVELVRHVAKLETLLEKHGIEIPARPEIEDAA